MEKPAVGKILYLHTTDRALSTTPLKYYLRAIACKPRPNALGTAQSSISDVAHIVIWILPPAIASRSGDQARIHSKLR
ncbi:unnamed protein product, partial [Rotaria socialis]